MVTEIGTSTANRRAVETEIVLRVLDRREAAEDVVELILERPDSGALPEWAPGAHVDLVLPTGLVRQYSLAGDPADRRRWRLGVLREGNSRGGSEFIHTGLMRGQELVVRGPRNHFELVAARRYVFIGGGIGITPLLPMIAQVDGSGAEWRLLYGGRTRRSMAFRAELERHGDRITFRPQDEFGLLDLSAVLAEPRADTAIYCCGPEPLIAATEELAASWPEDALHVERFSPRSEPGPVVAGSFDVELRRSGLTLCVPPGRSILDVVTEAGVDVLSSCEDGVCGTCLTPVIEGVPDHHDSVLSAGERKSGRTMALCVSRAQSDRLVLDL